MAIRFQCPKCNEVAGVHERMRGREIHCPRCNAMITIPETAESVEVGAMENEEWLNDDPAELADAVSVVEVDEADSFDDGSNYVGSDEDAPIKKVTFVKKELPKDDMDMTPMVDVTFLLLIFFMITASFTTEKALQQQASTDAPSTQAPQEETDTIKILIDEFNAYTVIFPDGGESEATSKQELISVLKLAELDGSSEDASSLVIEAHEDSIHSAVVGALDAGRQNKLTKFKVNVVDSFD